MAYLVYVTGFALNIDFLSENWESYGVFLLG